MNPLNTTSLSLVHRPRRMRRTAALRRIVAQTRLTVDNLVQPLFIVEGENIREPIRSMPGQARLSLDQLVLEVKELAALGIPAVALFPKIADTLKDEWGTESKNPHGLVPRAIRAIKDAVPDMLVICDVALDPFTSTGQDGIVIDDYVANDITVEALAAQALTEARAGADIVAPSDMMDGRIGAIRRALDAENFSDVAILSYGAKYASAFYGPFRDALDSAPRGGDKKSYQMDPRNQREAIHEVQLDFAEGADIVMVKPALPYLDVIKTVRDTLPIPVAAYHVSGEYAMVKAAAQLGYLDGTACLLESVTAIRRAGAEMIFTYAAKELAPLLR